MDLRRTLVIGNSGSGKSWLSERGAAAADRWIIEGIYGWIVFEILSVATALIWTNIDEFECVENIRHCGMRKPVAPPA